MSSVKSILAACRAQSQTEREKGSYFEELIRTYFRNEPRFANLYSDVWLFADWAKAHGFSGKDTGIDLVAKTAGTEEFHAIQCKCQASLNLRSRTLTEWTQESAMQLLRDLNCGPARQSQPFP